MGDGVYRKNGREEVVKLPNGAGLRVVHIVKDLPKEWALAQLVALFAAQIS